MSTKLESKKDANKINAIKKEIAEEINLAMESVNADPVKPEDVLLSNDLSHCLVKFQIYEIDDEVTIYPY